MRSTFPGDWGWLGEDCITDILFSFKYFKKSPRNSPPLTQWTIAGQPNSSNIVFTFSVTILAGFLVIGRNQVYRLKTSITLSHSIYISELSSQLLVDCEWSLWNQIRLIAKVQGLQWELWVCCKWTSHSTVQRKTHRKGNYERSFPEYHILVPHLPS